MTAAAPADASVHDRAKVLVFERVHARDAAGDGGRSRGALVDFSLGLGPGVSAILGAPEDGTLALLAVVSGARRPTRGSVTIAGRDPTRLAFLRARVGVLSHEPCLLPASTVGDSVRLSMRARGEESQSFDAILDPFGLSPLHARSVRSLGFAEARAVELALALSTPGPLFVVLHEPFAEVAMPEIALVRQRIRELGNAGVCVVVTTASPSDASSVGDSIHVLHGGSVARVAGPHGAGLVPAAPLELMVWVRGESHRTRALAAALVEHPDVRGVSWDEGEHRRDQLPSAVLAVRASAADDACAFALMDAAIQAGVEVDAIAPVTPSMAEVRAASETIARMRRGGAHPFGAVPVAAAPVAPVAAAPAPFGAPTGGQGGA